MASKTNHLEQLKLSKTYVPELFALAAATHYVCTSHKSMKDQRRSL